jgi:TPR repeat protein
MLVIINRVIRNTWLVKACEKLILGFSRDQGNCTPHAIFEGRFYEYGINGTKDFKKASKWYQKAAGQGHITATNNLAVLYLNGRGVEKDGAKAVELFTSIANKGDALAQANLGAIYANRMGVKKDQRTAFKWFSRAAEQGDVLSQYQLGKMLVLGIGVKKDPDTAANWFLSAAKNGYSNASDALFDLAVRFTNAEGMPF